MSFRRFLVIVGVIACIAITAVGGLPALLGLLVVGLFIFGLLAAITVIGKGLFPWAYPEVPEPGLFPIFYEPPTVPHKRCETCNQGMQYIDSISAYFCFGCGRTDIVGNGNGKDSA